MKCIYCENPHDLLKTTWLYHENGIAESYEGYKCSRCDRRYMDTEQMDAFKKLVKLHPEMNREVFKTRKQE